MANKLKMDDSRREQRVVDHIADVLVGLEPLTTEEKEVIKNLNPHDLYAPDIGERIKRVARENKIIVKEGRESKDGSS